MSGRTPSFAYPVHPPRIAVLAWVLLAWSTAIAADDAARSSARDVSAGPIHIRANYGSEWSQGSTRTLVLRGDCRIEQGGVVATAQKLVAWIVPADHGVLVKVYLEDQARLVEPGRTLNRRMLLAEFATDAGVVHDIAHRSARRPVADDPLYRRAAARLGKPVRNPAPTVAVTRPVALLNQATRSPGTRVARIRRLQVFRRGTAGYNAYSELSTRVTPPEQIVILTGGINVVVDLLAKDAGPNAKPIETIDLTADQAVIWTRWGEGKGFSPQLEQSSDAPLQIYLSGNIIIRQGDNVITAREAFYDAREELGIMRDAELKVVLKKTGLTLRVRAEEIRQNSSRWLHAKNASATTSQFAKPGYRVEVSDIVVDYRAPGAWQGAAASSRDQLVPWVTTSGNTFLIDDLPLIYLPYLSGPARELRIPLKRVTVEQDNIFGGQLRTRWDMFSLLNHEAPEGCDWLLEADYLSQRGPLFGTLTQYDLAVPGLRGRLRGHGAATLLHDDGRDNLGRDRRALAPQDPERGRLRLEHRQDLPGGFHITGEFGFVSDRNFLEQYYETEFDRDKDYETLIALGGQTDVLSFSLLAQPRLNEFETVTEWLPRGDIFVLSQPILGGLVHWTGHSSIGYGRLKPGEVPADPLDTDGAPPTWLTNSSGAVLMSRNELDMPLWIDRMSVVPYVMAETAYWSEDGDGGTLDRHVAGAGVRTGLEAWRVFPSLYSPILGLNGLAHKTRLEVDWSWTESTRSLDRVPQYNSLDDNAQERFRRRLLVNTFGGILPPAFDPRSYGLRSGVGRWITAPYHELLDDQQVLRVAWRNRLQTRTGPPGHQRTLDWMTLDLAASWFPRADRDNFGENLGLISGSYRWNLSRRTTLLADAMVDTFDDGMQLWNIGLLSQRTDRGSVLVALRQVHGASLDSRIATASLRYRMSPKWISSVATAYDLAEHRNRGQVLTLTRIGGDFLIHFGTGYDESRGTAGFHLSVEPRLGGFGAEAPQVAELLSLR